MRHTPWGQAQQTKTIAPGIVRVNTASHGGYLLDEEALARMPAALRAIGPWAGRGAYEEDCDWSIVALAFPQHFPEPAILAAVEMGLGHFGEKGARDWLNTDPQGMAVKARAEAFRTANATSYRDQGGMSGAKCGWTQWACRIDGKDRITVEWPASRSINEGHYALPHPFTEADIERLGGRITNREGA